MAKKQGGNPSVAATGAWDGKVKANKQVWLYLFLEEEILTGFNDSKNVTMKQMAWWNTAASPDVRLIDADKVAGAMHHFFKADAELPYEKKFTEGYSIAVPHLLKVLTNPDKTIPDLAKAVNDVFKFEDESDSNNEEDES